MLSQSGADRGQEAWLRGRLLFVAVPGRKAERRREAFLAALGALQDRLGLVNAAVAPTLLRAHGLPEEPAAITPERRARLLRGAEEAWTELMNAKRFW